MTLPPVFTSLGLTSDPFADYFRQELRPQSPDDLAQYACVEGFGRQVERIKSWFPIKSTANSNGALRVLVYGPNGSGRTSVGHYILQSYYQAVAKAASEQGIVKIDVLNDHPEEPTYLAFGQFQEVIYDQFKIDIIAKDSKLDEIYQKQLSEQQRDDIDGYRRLVLGLDRILGGRMQATTWMFENVRTLEQIDKASKALTRFPLLVFTTTSQDLLKSFRDQKSDNCCVELSHLSWEDVKDLISERWKSASSGSTTHPFDVNAIQEVFAAPKPFRAAVNMLAEGFAIYTQTVVQNPPSSGAALPPITTLMLYRGSLKYYEEGGR